MPRPALLWPLVAGACALAGCTTGEHDPPSLSCIQSPADIRAALRSAPGAVTLADGATLSDCVGSARKAADLQNVGGTLTTAAVPLEASAPRDPRAALELGYLVGAVERGATATAGLQDELVNRMYNSLASAHLSGAEQSAAARGRAAGRAHG
jgi:hypothetical protein